MLPGTQTNYLTFIERVSDAKDRALFKCVCGTVKSIRISHVRSGSIKSCKCKIGDLIELKYPRRKVGVSANGVKTPEYLTWIGMRQRCLNKNSPAYARYGGRGIKISKRWDSFECFLKDMGNRPAGKFSLDRIDNDRDYGPDNCRWATEEQQAQNKRSNIRIDYKGNNITVAEFARMVNLSAKSLYKKHSRGKDIQLIADSYV